MQSLRKFVLKLALQTAKIHLKCGRMWCYSRRGSSYAPTANTAGKKQLLERLVQSSTAAIQRTSRVDRKEKWSLDINISLQTVFVKDRRSSVSTQEALINLRSDFSMSQSTVKRLLSSGFHFCVRMCCFLLFSDRKWSSVDCPQVKTDFRQLSKSSFIAVFVLIWHIWHLVWVLSLSVIIR